MKKQELENLIQEINKKIENIDSLENKNNQANALLEENKKISTDLNQLIEAINNFQSQIESVKTEVQNNKEIVDSVAETAVGYSETIEKQKIEFESLKTKFENLNNNSTDLEETIKNQLGLVSTEVLANSFFDESEKLKKSSKVWFKWVCASFLSLFVSVVAVVIWQVVEEKQLFKLSLLLRMPIITPIIFFLYFVEKQYGKDRRLLDEYIFKASVARSFEAYRKLIKEEVLCNDAANQDKLHEKKLDFIIESIKRIYSSPLKENKKDKQDDDIGFNVLEKIVGVVKGIVK